MAVEGDQALLQGGTRQFLALNSMAWADSGAQRQGKHDGQTTQRWHGLSPAMGRARP
jgi:hypothetical protein